MSALPAAVPHGVRMVKALGLVTSADPAEFAAFADQVTAFEVTRHPPLTRPARSRKEHVRR